MSFSAAIVVSGLGAAASANAEGLPLTAAPVVNSGSSEFVDTGSGTGIPPLDIVTGSVACKLTGGDYDFPIGMLTGPMGCFGGLFGGGRIGG